MKIGNGQTKAPYDLHPVHYVMHGLNVLLTFALCCAVDVALLEYRQYMARPVMWMGTGEVTNFMPQLKANWPSVTNTIQFGLSRDGRVMWRVIK